MMVETTMGFARRPSFCQLSAMTREQLVAVDETAALVGDHHAVGVAVERDPDVGAHLAHLAAERLRLGGAAILVDVEAVGIDPDREHLGAEFPQRVGNDAIGRAVGAIDDDAQAVERDVARQGPLGEFDVAVVHAVDALGAPQRGGLGELLAEIAVDQLLDLRIRPRRTACSRPGRTA